MSEADKEKEMIAFEVHRLETITVLMDLKSRQTTDSLRVSVRFYLLHSYIISNTCICASFSSVQ